jgi:hypothetical protein
MFSLACLSQFILSSILFVSSTSSLLLAFICNTVQMPTKRLASRWHSCDDPSSDDSSCRGDDQFVSAPHPRRETRKSTHRGEACSSQADEEAANRAEGRAICEAREARERVEIQKVEHPLRPGYEYTLRRVDRRDPCRPTEFTLGENQSMVNRNENPFDWTTELHDHRF